MNTATTLDWTAGPAKWAAVIVLGGASIAGMAWSIFARVPAPVSEARPMLAAARDPATPPAPGTTARQSSDTTSAQSAVDTGKATAPARPARVNLNTASAAELELLPGIGPAIALRIVEHRARNGPFKSVNGLDDVKGIGPKTIEALSPLVTVE